MSEKSRWILFCLGIFSIAFGYRSIHIGQNTYLVPFEIIMGGLWGVLLLSGRDKNRRISIPAMLILVMGWSLVNGLVSFLTGTPWDAILSWMLPLIFGLPTFWVVSRLVKDATHLEIINRIYLAVAAFMSVCEIIEYYFQGIAAHFPWFFTTAILDTQEGFIRGAFSFWGYPAGASVVVFGLLIAYDNILRSKGIGLRLISLGTFAVGLVAVYVSGTRSAWLGLGLALLLLSLSNKLKGMVSLSVLLAASTILPPIFFARATTIVDAVSGNVFDTSLISRLDRWKWGINAILSNPIWGVGYGHWLVHNIFLEIGSTIGIIPAIAFLIFVIQLVMRIARVALNRKAPEARRYGWLFLAFAITWIIQLNVEAVFQTTALAVAFWPSMALGWYLSDMFPKSPDKDNQLSSAGSFYDHSINSNL
jgi:O-antigen ligase